MQSNWLFYLGAGINALILLVSLPNLLELRAATDGMTTFGRMATIMIPLALLALLIVAFWLRSAGKMLAANILLWIPALPLAGVIVFWGGLALLFILFGK